MDLFSCVKPSRVVYMIYLYVLIHLRSDTGTNFHVLSLRGFYTLTSLHVLSLRRSCIILIPLYTCDIPCGRPVFDLDEITQLIRGR